ncbi:acyl-CoA ligase (AMP-forming), exosortase A system-associated [Promicromonospora soli]|uniref:Acyl-CoA ligase (AMP-forming), exosortase A system-associated n=1 Tax=Promicromonospora soli TaxID=2035533 RepID=A0A919FUB0_9MICO|nr:acyl-CoA ligase (AMP-forming), exosortase A system-associated [Promicromonospora soli]GHH72572.1 acyl-CoA ligase (AMP-forming), exosortase A system-associated [Promicromonospora soli]
MTTAIHHHLEQQARVSPGAPALSARDATLTYAQLWQAARQAGAQLAELGVARHDRVAVYLEKRFETVAALWGTSVAGGVFVPVNPLLKGKQVAHVVRDSGARVLVTSPGRLAAVGDQLRDTGLTAVLLVDQPDSGADTEGLPGVTSHRWASAPVADPDLAAASLPDRPRPGPDTDIAAILYTSGSTGSPKGVVLSHRNLLVGATSVSGYLGNTADDVLLAVLPLSFDAGLSQLTTTFAVGAHAVLLDYLHPRAVATTCERYGVTGITGVPPLWTQLATVDWPPPARKALRYFANTGGRMPSTLLRELRDLFPEAAPYLMYGLTEAFRSTYLDPAQVDLRPDSIGRAIPNAEVLVLRPDGTRCAPDEPGELVHRGSLVALGYWNDPERTAARFRPVPGYDEAWRAVPEPAVWSGDTVVQDADGYLYFVGRTDEMIKTSGYRVSPTEVEEAALGTGLVREAVALGVPDARLGQRIVLVAAAPEPFDTDRLLKEMRQSLPTFMLPAEVRPAVALPRNPNGKLDRTAIRAQVTEQVPQ